MSFVFLTGFFTEIFLFDTYFEATTMTWNMKLFISAQRKIPTSPPRYFHSDWRKKG